MIRTVAIIAFTKRACELAQSLAGSLLEEGIQTRVYGPDRCSAELGVDAYVDLDAWTRQHFSEDDALVFVSAAGIAVRAIAPYIQDKFSDPAVVQLDESGAFVSSLLSGHLGGANSLARKLARLCGGQAIISTATDVNGVLAVDEWAQERNLAICERDLAKAVSAALLEGETIGFMSDFGTERPCSDQLVLVTDDEPERPQLGIHITCNESSCPFERTLHLVPRNLVVGIGCRKGTSSRQIEHALESVLSEREISPRAIGALASIDIKASEQGLCEYAEKNGYPLHFFSSAELLAQKGEFSHSKFVEETVGVDNVCERAAIAVCARGELICGKQVHDGVTIALARDIGSKSSSICSGRLSVVGLGPGKVSGMTLEARACIEEADLVMGYTVYVDLVKAAFPDKKTLATPMRKELERCRLALDHAAEGKRVALVCSGDPGVYGMAGLVLELASEYEGVEIEIVPGVSAANAGAAVLGAALMHDYTIISLSDLLTSWETIEQRLHAAAQANFVICLYNPSSHKRHDYLRRACDILLEHRAQDTVCGFVRNIGRDQEEAHIVSLAELRDTQVDMFTTVFVGNSQTKVLDGRMVTPRGYDLGSICPNDVPQDSCSEEREVSKFLLFGGTSEARELATWLSARGGNEVVVSSATDYGGSLIEDLPHVDSRVGRLSEEEIRGLIEVGDFSCVIDATHPYASSISQSVRNACEATGVSLERIIRDDEPHDAHKCFANAEEAARYIDGRAGRVLLTTGSKDLPAFTNAIRCFEERLFVRVLPVQESIERVRAMGIPVDHTIAMQGPFSSQLNSALIREYNIDILVTKASGSAGGFEEKLEAARECGVELVVIDRPILETGLSLDAIKERLESRYGA